MKIASANGKGLAPFVPVPSAGAPEATMARSGRATGAVSIEADMNSSLGGYTRAPGSHSGGCVQSTMHGAFTETFGRFYRYRNKTDFMRWLREIGIKDEDANFRAYAEPLRGAKRGKL